METPTCQKNETLKMAIFDDLDKIDLLVTDKEKSSVHLIIADHLPREEFDEGDHLEFLQDKINVYLHFVEDGQLIRTRPDLKGLPVVIRVDAKYPPSEEAAKFYRLAGLSCCGGRRFARATRAGYRELPHDFDNGPFARRIVSAMTLPHR